MGSAPPKTRKLRRHCQLPMRFASTLCQKSSSDVTEPFLFVFCSPHCLPKEQKHIEAIRCPVGNSEQRNICENNLTCVLRIGWPCTEICFPRNYRLTPGGLSTGAVWTATRATFKFHSSTSASAATASIDGPTASPTSPVSAATTGPTMLGSPPPSSSHTLAFASRPLPATLLRFPSPAFTGQQHLHQMSTRGLVWK